MGNNVLIRRKGSLEEKVGGIREELKVREGERRLNSNILYACMN